MQGKATAFRVIKSYPSAVIRQQVTENESHFQPRPSGRWGLGARTSLPLKPIISREPADFTTPCKSCDLQPLFPCQFSFFFFLLKRSVLQMPPFSASHTYSLPHRSAPALPGSFSHHLKHLGDEHSAPGAFTGSSEVENTSQNAAKKFGAACMERTGRLIANKRALRLQFPKVGALSTAMTAKITSLFFFLPFPC